MDIEYLNYMRTLPEKEVLEHFAIISINGILKTPYDTLVELLKNERGVEIYFFVDELLEHKALPQEAKIILEAKRDEYFRKTNNLASQEETQFSGQTKPEPQMWFDFGQEDKDK